MSANARAYLPLPNRQKVNKWVNAGIFLRSKKENLDSVDMP